MSLYNIDRRDALKGIATVALGGWLTELGGVRSLAQSKVPTQSPHIFVTSEQIDQLRSVAGARESIKPGISKDIWNQIQAECDRERGAPVLTARTQIEGRAEATERQNIPDYTICKAAGQRILLNALAMLLTGEVSYKKTALDQIAALLDESFWPDWRIRCKNCDIRVEVTRNQLVVSNDSLLKSLRVRL
jgi:hypothetical protein